MIVRVTGASGLPMKYTLNVTIVLGVAAVGIQTLVPEFFGPASPWHWLTAGQVTALAAFVSGIQALLMAKAHTTDTEGNKELPGAAGAAIVPGQLQIASRASDPHPEPVAFVAPVTPLRPIPVKPEGMSGGIGGIGGGIS